MALCWRAARPIWVVSPLLPPPMDISGNDKPEDVEGPGSPLRLPPTIGLLLDFTCTHRRTSHGTEQNCTKNKQNNKINDIIMYLPG